MNRVAKPAAASARLPQSSAEHVVRWSLRLFGTIDLLALGAFLMPTRWIQTGHLWCGLGPFPDGPIPEYLARATSLLWGIHGALLIFLSADVRQFVRVIRFIAALTVLAGGLLFLLALRTGLPLWWVLLEGPAFAATGLWYLWWLRHLETRAQTDF